jgi:hypothetical protein
MRKDAKAIGALIFLWVAMIGISVLSFLLPISLLLSLIITGVAIYGGVYLTKMLNVEYEYIVTNGEVDVDIITSKSKRKRLISFNCKDIEAIEAYTNGSQMYEKGEYDKKSIYCNSSDSDVYCISFKHKSIGKVCLVMQIPRRMQECMRPHLNKLIAREAFGK